MLKVFYSNKPEALVDRFQQDLEARVGIPPRDLYTPTRLVAASRPLEAWLKRQLVPRAGIVANLETWLLRRFFGELVERAFPDRRVLDGAVLRDLLLAELLSGDLSGDELSPVRSYVGQGKGKAVELRQVQLATELARLFEEYVYSRRRMLESWSQGKASVLDGGSELAVWQRRLWGRVSRRAGGRYLLPTRLLEVDPKSLVEAGQPLFVFGLSFVGTSYHELLSHLARAADVLLYTLNPCMEFWEDVGSVRDRGPRFDRRADQLTEAARASEDPWRLREEDCRPLALWGRPGREAVRLLNEATGGDTAGAFIDPSVRSPSLLRRLQADILMREPTRRGPLPTAVAVEGSAYQSADQSILVIRAPSLRRECEAVAGRIWSMLPAATSGGDPPLRLDDVAVLIAAKEAESYVVPLLAAFRENHDLPWQLVGLPYAATSPVVEAALLLLEVPLTRFARADVLRVLTHPVIAGRYAAAEVESWVRWVDEVGVAHGADRADHQGTYIDRDVLNWDQGLKRIALGAFLSTRAESSGALFEMGQERYLPATGGRHLDDGAGALLVLARSLLADARALSEGHRSVRGWAEALASLLEVYLVPRDDVERRALDACLATVRELAARDLGGAEISYLLAKELVLEGLETAGSSSGGAVTGGVRVSTLAASRGLPARATFVVGLSEGSFPAGDRSEALDLRPKRPLPGDASAREKDEYLFLEALLCTGDRLVLSYVAREAASGEERNPSPVVVELLRLLDQGYLGRGPGAPQPHPLSIAPPLWPADVPPEQDALVAPSASAVAQRRLRAARGSLESLLGPIPPERTARELVAQLPAARGAEVARALGLVAPPTGEIGGEEEPVVRVSFSDLRAYLLCPLQGSARVRLHLGRRDEEEETDELLDRDDEVFSSSALTAVPLLKESLVEAWRDARDRAEALTARPPPEPVEVFASWAARAERRQAEGRLPAGVFLEAEQESANAALAEWQRAAGELAEEDAGRLEVVRFGPAREHERIEAILPSPAFLFDRPGSLPGSPLGSGIRRLRVELVGATNPLLGRDASLLFVRSKAPKPADLLRTWKPLLSAWLDRLALVASGAARPGPWSVRVAYLDGPRDYRFAPLEAPEAKSVLEGLLYDLTLGDNELLLPFEAVVELLAAQASRRGREAGAEPSLPKKGKPRSAPRPERSFEQLVTEALEAFQGRACQGPLRGLRAFRIPGEPEVERLLARRFEPLFGRLENPPAGPAASEEGES